MNDRGFSLTIKELYGFKRFHNVKLTNVINRIPMMIDYVLREGTKTVDVNKGTLTTGKEPFGIADQKDRELAA